MRAPDIRQRPPLGAWVAIGTLALAVRFFYLWEIHDAPGFTRLVGDGVVYDDWARALAAGDWLGQGIFYQAPLYPYFLGVLYAVFGHDLLAVRIVQCILGALACALLGAAGSRLFCRTIGVFSGILLAVYPTAFFADGLIQKSSLDIFFVCLFLVALAAAMELRARPLAWLACGVVLGMLALTRENALALAPVAVAFVALQRRDGGWRTRALASASLVLGIALALSPVAVRNTIVGGEFHVTTAQLGPNLYIGNNPTANGMYRPLRYGRGDAHYERLDATELAERAVGHELTPGEVSTYWAGRAIRFALAEPGHWLRLVGLKAALFVNRVEVGDAEDQYTYAEWSSLLAAAGRALHYGVLVPLAIIGIVLGCRRGAGPRLVVALLFVYAASVIAMFVMARYRHPALPFLCLLAVAGVVEGVRYIRARRYAALGLAALLAAGIAVPSNLPLASEATVRAGSLYNIGRRLQDEPGGLDPAIAYYRRALDLNPRDAMIANNLGLALERRDGTQAGLPYLQRAVELAPGQADFHYNLAGALAEIGKSDEAVAAYQRTLVLSPDSADAHNNLGNLFQQRGDVAAAIEHYEAALRLDGRNVQALNNLGVAEGPGGARRARDRDLPTSPGRRPEIPLGARQSRHRPRRGGSGRRGHRDLEAAHRDRTGAGAGHPRTAAQRVSPPRRCAAARAVKPLN